MDTYIVLAVVFVIVGLAAWYVIRAKKRGKKCIGCPDGCCEFAGKKTDPAGGGCSQCHGCSSCAQTTDDR